MRAPMMRLPLRLVEFRRHFAHHRAGNVAILTAFIVVLGLFAIGITIDYTLARQRQDEINGFADAAVLMAVSPYQMTQSSTVAAAAARTAFLSQLATVPGVSYSGSNIAVAVNDTVMATGINRSATLTYTAASQNIFNAVIGLSTLPIGGTAGSTNGLSPKINFYLLLDTSPSMEIAATTAGINTMVSRTQGQGGCAFGCHELNPASDNLGNPSGVDNYSLARSLGITLRIDLVNQAAQDFMSYAPSTATANNTSYQVSIYTIDYSLKKLLGLTSDFSQAKNAAANLSSLIVYNNNCLTKSYCNNDEDSYLDGGLSGVNAAMPTPGNGTSNKGDSPQEVLFIVSDGVNDYNSGGRNMNPINSLSGQCEAIKARGIRIAFLYTTYYPLPTNSFYNQNIAPFQPDIATEAENCASPGLFFEVSTNGNISSAMQALFQEAVATAYLKQ